MTSVHVYLLLVSPLFLASLYQFHKLSIDTLQLANIVDEDFLSVTIDSSEITNQFDTVGPLLLSDKVLALTSALKPAYVRVGGTEGDILTFSDIINSTVQDTGLHRDNGDSHRAGFMSPDQFDTLNKFVSLSGWNMIFGLNQLLLQFRQDTTQVWDSSNAELLIRYCMKKGYNIAWELGNEPDSYYEHKWPNLTGAQGAANAHTLRNLMNDLDYPNTLIAGPDVAVLDRRNYLIEYLSAIGNTINATTWHHYYRNSEGAVITDFYDPKLLDNLISQINQLRQIVANASFTGHLWIGETSSTYGGGDPLFSSSFVSGFMWLDKLGLSAYHHKKVFRQELIDAKYSLLSSSGDPYPDYWLSLLYKKLVGAKVLNVADAFDYGRTVRIYAHCAKQPYQAGSVVLLILNVNSNDVGLVVTNSELSQSPKDLYWLTPYQTSNLTSQNVALNGVHLVIGKDNSLPDLIPKEMDAESDIPLPATSFGYVVFKNSLVKACM